MAGHAADTSASGFPQSQAPAPGDHQVEIGWVPDWKEVKYLLFHAIRIDMSALRPFGANFISTCAPN
jgi:hypothetical protein